MPKTHPEIKAELQKRIAKLHDNGLGPLVISAEVGLHYRTVVKWMYEQGIIPRRRPGKMTKHKLARIEAEYGKPIIEILADFRRVGCGQLEAAEKLGISNTHLRNVCDELRVPRLGRNNRRVHRPTREQALKASQAAVEKTSHTLTLGGVTKTYTEWAAQLGLSRNTFYARVKRGWPEENLLSGESPFEVGKGHGGRRV